MIIYNGLIEIAKIPLNKIIEMNQFHVKKILSENSMS
jgi:hypothetical protein